MQRRPRRCFAAFRGVLPGQFASAAPCERSRSTTVARIMTTGSAHDTQMQQRRRHDRGSSRTPREIDFASNMSLERAVAGTVARAERLRSPLR